MATVLNKVQKVKLQVNSKVADYGNDPFFVNKAEKSKAFLDKHGFPKELLNRKKLGI